MHCTGTDSTGFPISCDFHVTVRDCEAPTISCPASPVTQCADATCQATVTYTVTALDNCDGALIPSCTPPSGSTFNLGTTTVNCTVSDTAGNRATCSFDVTVNDCTRPTITCPGNKAVCITPGQACATVNFTVTASDNCGTPAITCIPASGSCFAQGTTTVNCTADDGHGNTASCSFSVNVSLCSGALTMGFWQNKNGQGIITSYCAGTSGTSLKTFLTSYKPFQDITATACKDIATYVYNVIKAANASGASMNAMLKAQMLATALDVYFSNPALGGVRISAPSGPIGNIPIDLTKVCKMIDSTSGTATCSGTYLNASSAFGGATCLTVSQLLTYAAYQSNIGGSNWYGQVKSTQELAKNTFDAINNQAAFTCVP